MQQGELYYADSQNIEYFPPTLFSFLFTSLNHCCLSVDNSRLLDCVLDECLIKKQIQGSGKMYRFLKWIDKTVDSRKGGWAGYSTHRRDAGFM